MWSPPPRRVSLGQAMQPFKRAGAIESMPSFGDALAEGAVSVGHVDVIATALDKLDGDERTQFAERGDFLAEVAERSTPGEFARTVRPRCFVHNAATGSTCCDASRRRPLLKTWVDQASGMWCLHGEFDPETGSGSTHGSTRTIEKLFHDTTPDTAPQDPLDKQHHLRALARSRPRSMGTAPSRVAST